MVGRLDLLGCSIYRLWLQGAQRKPLSVLGVPGEGGPRHSRLGYSAIA